MFVEELGELFHCDGSPVLRGEFVVVEDGFVGDAEQAEQQRRRNAGAVFAGDAVKQQRALRRVGGEFATRRKSFARYVSNIT